MCSINSLSAKKDDTAFILCRFQVYYSDRKDQAGNLNSSLLFLHLYCHGDFCHHNWKHQLQGWIMKWDMMYFGFPSKSAEPAKLWVHVININTLQVTLKNHEGIQNCLRCCLSGAEMVNLVLVCRKAFLDTFHCQLHVITSYSSAWGIVTSSHRLSVFRTGIEETVQKTCWCEKTVSVMGECYMFSSLTSSSSWTSSVCWSTDHNFDPAG